VQRVARIAEVHGHPPLRAQFFVNRHGLSLTVGVDFKNIARACWLGMRQLDEDQHVACVLGHSDYTPGIGLAFDDVTPGSRKLPVFNLRGTNIDAKLVGKLAASILAIAAWSSFVMGLTKICNQIPAHHFD